MTWPPDGVRRIRRHDLSYYQPVEKHADGGQMLLDRGSRPLTVQLLDIGRNMHRLHPPQFANSLPFAPAQEISGGPRIRRPRVFVTDVDGEEFEEAKRGTLPCPRDERRKVRSSRLINDC